MQLYQLSFPNGKSYIGITSNTAQERFKQHCRVSSSKKKYAVHTAIHKYGKENVVVTVLATTDNWELLCLAEIEAIEKYQSFGKKGYNLTLGGDGKLTVGIYGKDRVIRDKSYMAEYGKAYCDANKDRISARNKAYRKENKDVIAEKMRAYNKENKAERAVKSKAHREKNKLALAEKRKEYCKATREKNREIIAKRAKAYREANKESISAKAKEKYKAKKILIIGKKHD